jgi:phytoene desaturase
MPSLKVVVIGAGMGGITAAALLAKQGFDVTVLERHDQPGGRARVWREGGFTFDMGPSWYLMPDVFERFFAEFGKRPSDYYTLKRMDPSYRVFFEGEGHVDITPRLDETKATFEGWEAGAGARFQEYLDGTEYQYNVAMADFVYKAYKRLYQFMNRKLLVEGSRLHLLENLDRYIQRFFKDHRIRKVLEYNIVFLGGAPKDSPALYALMSHVDFNLGVWYPMGGLTEVVRGFHRLAKENGAKFYFGHDVKRIIVKDGWATGVETDKGTFAADVVLANADYHHVEQELLEPQWRSYTKAYWEKRKMAPSTLLFYLGLDRRVEGLQHHNLYLRRDWDAHFRTIFKEPGWPDNPCYYVSVPSITDPAVTPEGKENMFVLVPVAAGLEDTEETRERYFDWVIGHLEGITGQSIRDHIVLKRSFAHRDFEHDYSAYRGTALGLAHTLRQTAVFRLRHTSKRVENLYFTGHYCHPGIGVPMVIISSQIVSEEIGKNHAA